MASLVDDVRCVVCRGLGVFLDVDRSSLEVTVSARCYTCGHDFGVIGSAPVAAVESEDEVLEAGEAVLRLRMR